MAGSVVVVAGSGSVVGVVSGSGSGSGVVVDV